MLIKKDDRDDMQGLLDTAYVTNLHHAAYLLLHILEASAAKECLRSLLPPPKDSNASNSSEDPSPWAIKRVTDKAPCRAANLAFTCQGLRELGLPGDTLGEFSIPFRQGMTSARSIRLLGDRDRSDPKHWEWGAGTGDEVHALLLLYATTQRGVDDWILSIQRDWKHALRIRVLDTTEAQIGQREHFGFADGISQPRVAGLREYRNRLFAPGFEGRLNIVPTGEFILGYSDASGTKPGTPSVSKESDPSDILPCVPGSTRRDFGRNGTYLVFRQLAQDVGAFHRCTAAAAARLYPNDAQGTSRLQEKLIGRQHDGTPLVPHRTPNDFLYARKDTHGEKCPLSAHIRRANPRDGNIPGRDDERRTLERTTRHRLLRRGRLYGPRFTGDNAQNENAARGLHFICLNADIQRQFEFVQRAWLGGRSFAPFCDESDAILANADAGQFTVPMAPTGLPMRRVSGLSAFVTVRGGAYFFLPGMRALRYLLQSTNSKQEQVTAEDAKVAENCEE
jgi:Dyp-type peroxidase family